MTLLGHSQIKIENGAFIYSDSVLVYSEDYVDIDGHFYLRNEAQLIQKNNVANNGTGQLSVYQWGTVNEYAYNYWSSPVGSPFVAENNIYDAIDNLNSNVALYNTSGYNSTTNPLVIADYWIWKFIAGTEYSEWIHVRSTGDVDSGYGFTMKGTPSSNQLYDFRGIPNNGTMYLTVLDENLTLIGNPYPSSIDAYDLIWNTNNQLGITGVLYYWEQQTTNSHVLTNYIGGYGIYTIDFNGVESYVPAMYTTYDSEGNPTGTNNGIGVKVPKRYIPIGQGFMVKGAGGSNYIEINNSMRKFIKESSGDSYFFRTPQNEYKRFRLNITLGNGYTRQLLMNFNDSATNGFDYGMEDTYDSNLPIDAYWTGGKLINALEYNPNVTIPIHIKSNTSQNITFRISDIQNLGNKPVYLYNSVTNEYTNLRNNDVTVMVVGDSDNFFIKFNKSNNNKTTAKSKEIKSIEYYTIDGKSIKSIENASIGIYIMKITFMDGRIESKQILKK